MIKPELSTVYLPVVYTLWDQYNYFHIPARCITNIEFWDIHCCLFYQNKDKNIYKCIIESKDFNIIARNYSKTIWYTYSSLLKSETC